MRDFEEQLGKVGLGQTTEGRTLKNRTEKLGFLLDLLG